MLVCLFAALVLLKGINADLCNGSIIVREPVLQNRTIMVTFTSTSLDQYTTDWTILTGWYLYKQSYFPRMFNKTFQNSSVCSLAVTNYIKNIQWRSLKLRVELKDAHKNVVCHMAQDIEMTDLGECGNLRVSDTFTRKGPVDLVLVVKHRQEYHSFTLLFINDADDKVILYHESMEGRTIPFTYTLDTPRSDGIYLVMCEADVKTYSTSLRLEKAGTPLMKVFPGNMVTKREGETLTLNCTVDSTPRSRVSWYIGNNILSEPWSARCDNHSECYQSYHFESLVKSHSGNYTCIAQNDLFESMKEIVVLQVTEQDSLTGNAEPKVSCPEVRIYQLGTAIGGASALILIIGVVVAAYCYIIRHRKKYSDKLRSRPEVSGPYQMANRSAIETDHQYDQTAPIYDEAESAYA